MVEQDAVDREQPVGLTIVAGHPVRIDLGGTIGRTRPKRGLLILRWGGRTEHLRAAGLIEACRYPAAADRLQQPGGAQTRCDSGELGLVERDPNM